MASRRFGRGVGLSNNRRVLIGNMLEMRLYSSPGQTVYLCRGELVLRELFYEALFFILSCSIDGVAGRSGHRPGPHHRIHGQQHEHARG